MSASIGTTQLAPGVALQNGRYVIERALGSGGMGAVFLARDRHLDDKPVALKEMSGVYASEAERRAAGAAFQAEMRTLAALSHPTIPQISDFFTESGRLFAVQEYISGQDLQKAIEEAQQPGRPPQGLPERQVLGWVGQVLDALAYLEAQQPPVIHRDIKPANIIVDASGRVRLVDFGIAVRRGTLAPMPGTAAPTSDALGTPGYAPPEQFAGRETPLSDLYALGATMHYLLTGRDPSTARPLWQYPPVRALSPAVSAQTERLVARSLQDEPGRRFQSAAAMKQAVERAARRSDADADFWLGIAELADE